MFVLNMISRKTKNGYLNSYSLSTDSFSNFSTFAPKNTPQSEQLGSTHFHLIWVTVFSESIKHPVVLFFFVFMPHNKLYLKQYGT